MTLTTPLLFVFTIINAVFLMVLWEYSKDDKDEKNMLHRLQQGSGTEDDLDDLHSRSVLLVYSNLWYGLPVLLQGLLLYEQEYKSAKLRLWLLTTIMVIICIFSTLKHSFEHHSKIDNKQMHCQTYQHHKTCVAEGRCPMNDEYVYICLPYEWVTRLDWMVARQGVLVIIWLIIGSNDAVQSCRKLLGPLPTLLLQSGNLLALLWCIVHDITFLSRPTEQGDTATMQSLGYGILVIVISAALTLLVCHHYLKEGQRIWHWPRHCLARTVLLILNLVAAFIANRVIPNDVLHLSHVLWHMTSSTSVLCAMALTLQWTLSEPNNNVVNDNLAIKTVLAFRC